MDSAIWTYSQLDRILRPLRNRCSALATFSRRSLTFFDGLNPLSTLPPPDTVGLRIRLARPHVKTLELSHKLYAVRDCFRTLICKILGINKPQRVHERAITLADLCATVVGNRLDVDSDQADAAELFEAIPSQYRRTTAVAHSLDLILQLCPHNYTLLLLLLEVTSAFGLSSESNYLLQAILTLACCPDATSHPLLCHPAHQSFLIDLCNRWTSYGRTAITFVRILLSVARTAAFATLWSCEAMKIFFLQLAQDDMATYMSSLYLLMQTLTDVFQTDPPSMGRELYRCLQLWLSAARRSLFTLEDDYGLDHLPVLLDRVALLLEPCSLLEPDDAVSEIKNASICLATHWLSRNRLEHNPYQLECIEHLLSKHAPLPRTFNALVSPIVASGDLQMVKDRIQKYAHALRSRHWLQYEASLWACSLRQIEVDRNERVLSSSAGTTALRDFRLRLIDQVEDAEKRCFGSVCRSTSTPGQHGSQKRSLEDSGEWDLDPTFWCWLPACDRKQDRKKLRMSLGPECCPQRLACSAFCKGLTVQRSLSVCSLSDDPEQHGGERVLPSLSIEEDFVTLVSRAASKRVVLHREERHGCPSSRGAAITTEPESDDILLSYFYHD